MKKKILIPTDFSENAWNAITYAAALYKDTECRFYLLNSFLPAGHDSFQIMDSEPGTLTYDTAKKKSENGLTKTMETIGLQENNPKHSYLLISQHDELSCAIKSIINKHDIELVVMGTKGAGGKGSKLFGSNTIEVMEHVRNCPILGVPIDAHLIQIKEIVFPASFKTHYKRRELFHLLELAQIKEAIICVLHINKNGKLKIEQEENKLLLEECLEGVPFSFHEIGGSDPAASVHRFVESRNSDMIAFINRKHSVFSKMFSTPMANELGMFSKVPFLVLHDLSS